MLAATWDETKCRTRVCFERGASGQDEQVAALGLKSLALRLVAWASR